MFQPKSPESIEAAHAAQSAQADPAADDMDTAQDDVDETAEHHDDVKPETDDVEATEDDETAEDDAAQGDPEKWVVPGKFRTTADLVAAYQNAESQLGRLHRELSELRRQGAGQKQVDDKQQQIVDAERNRELLRDFVRDPQGTLAREAQRIVQEQQQQSSQRVAVVHTALAQVAQRYSDFAELQGQVSEYISTRPAMQRLLQQLQADPHVTQEDYADLLDTAYHAVRAQTAGQALHAAREQGRQEGQASKSARRKAQGARQRAKQGHAPAESYAERVRRETLAAGPPSQLFGS